jgi:Ca-activated chloride channel family protein
MNTELLLDQEPHAQGCVVRALLRITGEAFPSAARAALNLAVVLDRSGSMEGPKLQAAREAAAQLVQRLAPTDRVHVVAYDDQVRNVPENEIRNIQAGGSTNLSGGWLRGRDQVARHVTPGSANRILLLTDGLANVGITDPEQLVAMCAVAKQHGMRTTTIGFGADYDEHLLGCMAEAGGGHLHYIEHADQAVAIFADELEGLLSLAAQNLTVTIVPAETTQAVAVHHSYPRYETADGLRLELGDLYAREPKLVLMEFLVNTLSPATTQVARVVIEGAVLGGDGSVKQQEIVLDVTTSIADGPVTNAEVRRELLLLEAAQVREQALRYQAEGDYNAATASMLDIAQKLQAAGIDDAQVREEAADLQYMANALSTQDWGAADRKYMMQRAYDSSRSLREKSKPIARTRRNKPDA